MQIGIHFEFKDLIWIPAFTRMSDKSHSVWLGLTYIPFIKLSSADKIR